jgi:mevalonate kinase
MADAYYRVTVPAKAMLFGEYGVLEGGPAVAVSFPQFVFVCEFQFFKRRNENVALLVESDFFSNGALSVALSDLDNPSQTSSRDVCFFAGACAPWKELFHNFTLKMKVLRSFEPSLGFGSSSALIAAIHRTFARIVWGTANIIDENIYWERVFDTLRRVQGGGSGYDVAVQSRALWFHDQEQQSSVRAWRYDRCENVPSLQELCFPDLADFGFFLASHVYSNTSEAIKTCAREKRFLDGHAHIAHEFLKNPGKNVLVELMSRSRAVAREQGILPSVNNGTPFAELCFVLDNWKIPWKHMGSGLGDCVWIAAPAELLASAIHPVTHRPLREDIVFQFSLIGV